MNYHLSPRIILTTMQALAAVQSLASDADRALLAPILCRERTPLLAVMIRNAFADIVMRLGPMVADVSLGDESAASSGEDEDTALLDLDLMVELHTPRTFTGGRHATIRRALEQNVALSALSMWSVAAVGASHGSGSGASCGKGDAAGSSVRNVAANAAARDLADRFAAIASEWHTTLRTALNPTYPCGITERY